MAYTKTTWQNNVTDIDANNLNKIEQGIYDNSLVVDAVTNTINPTDTETYKTAELTEEQITDVIGVSDILIKGDTEQDGTPTPSAPVDVNVVSGSNVINTSNKNLLKLTNYSTQTINGINLTFKNGAIICNGTATANVIVNLLESDLTLQQGAYALSGCPSGGGVSSNYKLDIFKVNTNAQLAYDIGNGTTFTLSEQTTFDRVRLVIFNGKTVSNLVFKPQLEQNSAPTTYEPHQGKELPLDLPVENLFDKNNITDGQFINADGTLSASVNYVTTDFIPITPNAKYYLPKTSTRRLKYFNSNKQVLSSSDWDIASSISGQVLTTPANAYYVRFSIDKSQNNINTFQFEQGSKANAYTPYGTEPIELCKIGDYQDYFYKSGSKWYLHKEIGKFYSNSTDGWTNDGNNRYSSNTISNIVVPPNNDTKGIGVCNVGLVTANQTRPESATPGAAIHTVSKIYISKVVYDNITTTNVILYYIYTNPIITEITNTTLISQLEAIYNAPLYEETNITQTNNDLPMVLDITACKDNINGIKAFIRK